MTTETVTVRQDDLRLIMGAVAIGDLPRVNEALKRCGEALSGNVKDGTEEEWAAVAAERERCARHLEALAANYPADVFPSTGTSRDAIGGSAMRHALMNAARSLREDELREPEDAS